MNQENNSLEEIVEKEKWYMSKFFWGITVPTEIGSLAGGNIGIFSSSSLTDSSGIITAAVLSGDFVVGTMGLFIGYGISHREKFRDQVTGKFKYLELTKDLTKLLGYGIPITAVAYASAVYPTYHMVDAQWPEMVIAAVSWVLNATVWNGLTYFLTYYNLKTNFDEKAIKSAYNWAKEKVYHPKEK